MYDIKMAERVQGRSDGGGYRDLYPPKSAKVNFLWGKNDVRTAFNSFIHPQKLLYPPKQISGYAPERVLEILSLPGRPITLFFSSPMGCGINLTA